MIELIEVCTQSKVVTLRGVVNSRFITDFYIGLPSYINDLNDRGLQGSSKENIVCKIKIPGKDLGLEIYGIKLALSSAVKDSTSKQDILNTPVHIIPMKAIGIEQIIEDKLL